MFQSANFHNMNNQMNHNTNINTWLQYAPKESEELKRLSDRMITVINMTNYNNEKETTVECHFQQ